LVDFKCPGCDASHQLPDRVSGRKFRCPSCKAKVKHHPDGRIEIKEAAPASAATAPAGLEIEDDVPEISLPALNRDVSAGSPPPPKFFPESLAGLVVGNYKLIGLIGSGSAGHVYAAEHLTLKRKMAVKLLAPAVAPSPDRVQRLSQEAVALAKVDHPNVVHVYDFWVEKDNPYIAMQFVDGPSLDQAIKSGGPFPSDKLIKLAQELLTGLDVIHQAGLLHRDIKPSNVLLTQEGDARLADFGLAWETPQVSALPAKVFSGTAEYAAPELAVGQPPDARTDLYALGGTLYKAATGKTPFSGGTVAEKLKKQLYEPLAPPTSLNPKIAPSFEIFLQKLLSKDRDARPASAKDALKYLGPLVAGPSPQRKSTRRIVAVRTATPSVVPVLIVSVALAGSLGAIAYFGMRPKKADAKLKEEPKKEIVAKIDPIEPVPPLPPKPSTLRMDVTERGDYEHLEHVMSTGTTSEAISECEVFLNEHPQSIHCESILIRKMELQRELERKIPPPAQPIKPQLPPPAPPPPPKYAPVTVKALKRSTTGVPCRPLPAQIRDGLCWLARHQTEGGYWDMQLYPQLCSTGNNCSSRQAMGNSDYHIGVNSLAVLAFLGAGIGLNARDEVNGVNLGDSVREGVRYLVRAHGADGRIGDTNVQKHLYNQALAVNALAEAVRSLSTGSGFPEDEARRLRVTLDAATQYLLVAQNPMVGWRYGVRSGDNDSSVTAAALLALHAARRAGAAVPNQVFASGLEWFRQVTEPTEQRIGYKARGTGKVYIPGQNEQYLDHATLTAAAGVCQMLVGKESRPSKSAILLVARDLPQSAPIASDYYYWYYGTRFAAVAFEARDLEAWKSAVVKALTETQILDPRNCQHGAWSANDRWSCEGGRLYATALNTITLEYATVPRPSDTGPSPQPDVVTPQMWIFKLKNGGRVQAASYEEEADGYYVKIAGGIVKLLKTDIEQVLKVDPKAK
jgi:serine/threonine protein kinase